MLTFTVNVNKLRRISTVFLCSFFPNPVDLV